jgi:putative nucleotidyltransferase with HDIG domain
MQGYYKLEVVPELNCFIFFGVLAILANNFSEVYKNMYFNSTFAITTCVFILYGPVFTAINIVIGQTFKIVKINKSKYKHIFNTPFYGTLFNYCSVIVALYISSFVYIILGGKFTTNSIVVNKISILVFFVMMFLLNNLIISILSAITANKGIIYCFVSNFRLTAISIFAMAPLGIIIALLYEKYKYYGVVLVVIPLIFTRYTLSLYVKAKNQNIEIIDTLMKAIENRDQYTEGHSQRVADLSAQIAKKLKFSEWKIEDLRTASMLHDVGKIGIRDNILNKPGKLTDEEYSIIKSHPEKGYDILKGINAFQKILQIIKYHHERYDGKGYPEGKRAEELDIEVFIVQLADSIDAMSTDRIYRPALTKEEILEEVKKCSGTQFHPMVVEAYLKVIENEENVRR